MEVGVINNSIKFFVVFLMAFSVFAGGDDRDQAYYENLDEELAAFEAQLAEDLANQKGLEAFQQKLADEKAAAAKSNAAYQSKLANEAQVAARMEELALEQELIYNHQALLLLQVLQLNLAKFYQSLHHKQP